VAIIALAYSRDLYLPALAGAGLTLAVMVLLSRLRSTPIIVYIVGLVVVWGFTLSSGVNTSIAGFAAAMTVPIQPQRPGEEGVLRRVIEALHPWTAWLVLPLFAFTAAGLMVKPTPQMIETPKSSSQVTPLGRRASRAPMVAAAARSRPLRPG
jgi:NhaA family Na+:H+ antiporter